MDAPLISAKNGIGIDDVLEQIVKKIPAPTGDPDGTSSRHLSLILYMIPIKALSFFAGGKER